jgi:hypothetical protein
MDCVGPFYLITIFLCIRPYVRFDLLLEPVNKTLERFLVASLVSFHISYIKSEAKTNFSFQLKEGGMTINSVNSLSL